MTEPDKDRLLVTQDVLESEVAALVDSAPETLDTLSELAAALGDDPNFATTTATAIGERAKTSDVNAALAGKADVGAETTATWAGVSGKPSTFTPTTGSTASTAKPGDWLPTWGEVSGKPATFTPSSHTHTVAQVTGLQGALDGKAATGHTHTKAQVGLGNVDNTADADKPVSTATQAAINAKVQLVTEFPSSPTPGVLYLKAD